MPTPTWKATLLIAGEELRGSFRDRQTLIYTVVLPICMYPVLFWIMLQGALVLQGRRERTEVLVGLATTAPEQVPASLVSALERRQDSGAGGSQRLELLRVVRPPRPLDQDAARAWLAAQDAEDAPDAVLWLPGRGPSDDAQRRAQLYFDGSDSLSRLARKRLEERLDDYLFRARNAASGRLGASPEDLVPFEIEDANVAPGRDMLAYILSFMLPMLLVVMCVMGAFFPAVDVTAGEKERSTAETTLLLPVPRVAIHQGKILAVCAASVLATVLNLTALGLSAEHLLSMLSSELGLGLAGIPVVALIAVLPLALMFAFFVSAVLVGVASMAATFKEGQALLGPVQMVFLLPAMVAVLPGLTLDLRWAVVPVVNVVLAFRSMLQGRVLPAEYTLTALSLLVYALIAIRLAVRLLSREGVQLADQTLPLSRLLRLLRSTEHAP